MSWIFCKYLLVPFRICEFWVILTSYLSQCSVRCCHVTFCFEMWLLKHKSADGSFFQSSLSLALPIFRSSESESKEDSPPISLILIFHLQAHKLKSIISYSMWLILGSAWKMLNVDVLTNVFKLMHSHHYPIDWPMLCLILIGWDGLPGSIILKTPLSPQS